MAGSISNISDHQPGTYTAYGGPCTLYSTPTLWNHIYTNLQVKVEALLDEDNIGSNNYTYYKNDEVHKLFIQAQTEVDEEKRNELYKQAQVLIHEDAPWVNLAHSTPLLAAKANVEGFVPHPTGSESLHNVFIK